MKTKLAILLALASAGGAFGAYADIPPPVVPAGGAPNLSAPEQGAFKAIEVAAQLAEARIVQKGCQAASYPLSVHTDANGNGTATLDNVNLNIAFKSFSKTHGRRYVVSGAGSLGDLAVGTGGVVATGSYNIGSTIQELTTNFKLQSPNNPAEFDNFRGTIIKDYWRPTALLSIPKGFTNAGQTVSHVIDYGYQQVQKSGYTKAKWWQFSRSWREDGVVAGTIWTKTRVQPSGCAIEVRLEAYSATLPGNNNEGFNQDGTLVVVGPSVPTKN